MQISSFSRSTGTKSYVQSHTKREKDRATLSDKTDTISAPICEDQFSVESPY